MNKTNFSADKNVLTITRAFNADVSLVWRAWTEAEILDQWWAPKPWKSITKSMDFKEEGKRVYAMKGPNGEEHWCITTYKTISKYVNFSGEEAFANSDGSINEELPVSLFKNSFEEKGNQTLVTVVSEYASEAHLQQVLEMGMKEGLSIAFENLDQYLFAQFSLRKQNKENNKARVATYLNFPGNTEEAFNFYKTVFKTEFINGIKRFGDIEPQPGTPPVQEAVKNMVLHVELPILGGHILMATDSPKEMGFTLTQGNNMHINLEPESREEANRIFKELSADGKIEMPLQDMFFGAYFGNFTDKFGINWIINYQNK